MFRRLSFAVLAVCLMLAVTACTGQGGDALTAESYDATQKAPSVAESLLTPADLQSVTGLAGVKTVPFDSKSPALIGDVNLVDASGNLLATVVVGDSERWEEWLTDGYSVSEPVAPPVGDESFVGPNPDVSPVLTIFAFRKGEVAVIIETTLDGNGEAVLSTEQLRAIADIVVGRL